MSITINVANSSHVKHAQTICDLIEAAAFKRGTGIAKRDAAYIAEKLKAGKAVIALQNETVAGFCYIEGWDHAKYVANSGLIVAPDFQRKGLAKKIKAAAFYLARSLYPSAKVFGITTSLPVMKINTSLGYQPVTFSELTQDATFWNGCKSCPNYDVLTRNDKKLCLCTGMLAPSKEEAPDLDKDSIDIFENLKTNNHGEQ